MLTKILVTGLFAACLVLTAAEDIGRRAAVGRADHTFNVLQKVRAANWLEWHQKIGPAIIDAQKQIDACHRLRGV